MRTLEEIIQAKGWATRAEIERALVNLRTLGGGLDTCLLETGVVSEGQVLEALERRHGVPSVDPGRLLSAPENARELLSAKVARRCRAVAFESLHTAVRVAFQDPDDLSCQDEVGFALGRRIEIHVTTEVRLEEALERFYGIERSTRMASLADQLDRGARARRPVTRAPRPVQPPPAPPAVPPGAPLLRDAPELPMTEEAPAAPRRHPGPPPKPSSVSMTAEESRRLRRRAGTPEGGGAGGGDGDGDGDGDGAGGGEAPGGAAELTPELFEELARRLDAAQERDTVGRALLSLVDSVFVRGGLLAVLSDRVEGWMGIDDLRLPLDQPSVFLNLKAGLPYHLGPLPPGKVHDALMARWPGAPRPENALLVPVRVGGRPVVVLYGDLGKRPPGQVPVERFLALADRAADALKRCILLKKKHLGS
jgi:hypothetical protein